MGKTGRKKSESTPVAVITGGNSGIGKATANALAEKGWNLFIVGRRQEENDRVAREISKAHGTEAIPYPADVSIEESCVQLVREAAGKWGCIDLFVNNAGTGGGGKIADSTTEIFDRVLRTNLYSTYWCSREVYKLMTEQAVRESTGLRGSIINISSVCGVDAWAGSGIYCASKHGIMALTRAMADEGAEDRIRVAAVCPALVATPMTGAAGPDVISPQDIASTVTYLLGLSPAAWPTEIVVKRRGAD